MGETRQQGRGRTPQETCDDFNRDHPVGTRVRYWTGTREGPGLVGVTRTEAHLLSGHTAVVWVSGVAGCIALSHIEPAFPDLPGELECNQCGKAPREWGLLRGTEQPGDRCPCSYLDDYDCDGTLVLVVKEAS